jgi:transposase|tara:strand:+ start:123 stop:1895 length:1773 start_codon:yes stop_codon:yes gene_type:complete
MLTVEDYAEIRRAHRDGMSIRAIAKQYHRSRRKIREALKAPEPEPYTRTKTPAAPKLGAFIPVIDEILDADQSAPPKQRHTAAQLFRRIVKEGYSGGYDQVRRYVAKHRIRERETFLPLDHAPGQRAEADFGHIYVDFPEGRRMVNVLLLTWAHSYRPFAIALPTERVEAILHGMVEAFEFFGTVPRELWWDNPTTVATAILTGRQRTLHPRYQALASHYNFNPLFCMPARGNEKPYVENRVKNLQRRWATPVPQVRDIAELNTYLRECCEQDLERVATGQSETIGTRFEQERATAVSLPDRRFDDCISDPRKVDKYQTVAFDNNRYSVPRAFAFQAATVKAYVNHIEVVVAGQMVARHERSYASGEHLLDPQHYLMVLGRKPAYLDHTAVFKDWKLPAVFGELRDHLEKQHGENTGSRQFIRVLQLLATHPLSRVQQAVEGCRSARWPVDLILGRAVQLSQSEARCEFALGQTDSPATDCVEIQLDSGTPPRVHVPQPNLKCFDQFLVTGGHYDGEVQRSNPTFEDEPQAPSLADHAGGIREVGAGGVSGQRRLPAVPAAINGIGTGHPRDQRLESEDQASGLPGREGL